MAKIVQLFFLLILTLFSSQSYSNALCPDGSKPIQTISADGSYYVPQCGAAFKGVNSSISSISKLPKCLSDPWHNCFGSFTWSNDNPQRYVGEWKNDKSNGIGTTYYLGEYTGDIYIGEHYDGYRSGVGIYFFKNKAYDAGVWKKDKLNGLGIQVNSAGQTLNEGIFKDDIFQYYKKYIPKNASKSGNSWVCKYGYAKVRNLICVKKQKKLANLQTEGENIPKHAHKTSTGWVCNKNFYRNNAQTGCLKAPIHSTSSYNSNYFKCNSGYKKSGSKCVRVQAYSGVPENGFIWGASFACEAGFYRNSSKTACLKVPKNATKVSISKFTCNTGYKKSGSKCIPNLVIPANAKASGSSWTCSKNYYRNDAKTACLRVPLNSTSSSLSNYFTCNSGYKKSGSKCIPNLVIPANAKASGSSFMCNSGFYKNSSSTGCLKVPANAKKRSNDKGWLCNSDFYKNSSSTGCLKVPANAKKRSNDKGWSCNTGYTKTGTACTNTAELERINKAKKIAEEKAAKERKAAQLEAQNYYRDLELFLKSNGSEYDVVKIVTLIAKNKAILTSSWNEVLAKNFAELKSFTATSKAFRDYHKSRNDQRQRAILNELDKANTRLKNINAFFNDFLQNNLTADIAIEVLDQIDIAEDGLKKQNLDELSKVSAQLESFIAQNKLSQDYLAFVKSLAKTAPDEPEVVVQKIDAKDLVNFDFMKEANRSDYIALINLTGKAPNALLDLEGSIVFENDKAVSCFYQSKDTIKNDLKYYLYDKFSDKEFLVQDRGFECNQNNLLSYDLVFFEKGTLLKETKSYVAALAAAIANNELQLYKKVTNEDREKDFDYRTAKVRQIIEGIEDEMLLGFGSLIIDNDNTSLCTDVKNSIGQASIMNLLSNEFTRMGYGKSVGNVTFSSVEDTFAKVQRGRCGFIYANEESLAKLLKALKSLGTKYDILPVWYSKKMVKNEQLRQESKNQSELMAMQKAKEQKDKDKKLAEQRAQAELEALKASGAIKAAEQKRLQARHRNAVEAHIQVVEKEAALLLDKDPENTGPMLILYPGLDDYLKDKIKEGWELDSFSVEISDFGLGNFRGRMIETFITDINFRLKNRLLGEYSPSCARVAIIDDLEFDMLREPELQSCKEGSMNTYKQKLNFQSTWLVQ